MDTTGTRFNGHMVTMNQDGISLKVWMLQTISVSSLPLTLEISLISEPHVSHAFIRSDAITKNLSELSQRNIQFLDQ